MLYNCIAKFCVLCLEEGFSNVVSSPLLYGLTTINVFKLTKHSLITKSSNVHPTINFKGYIVKVTVNNKVKRKKNSK